MLFISYASEDRAIVQPLAKLLRASGNEIFIDHENLDYGSDWKDQLNAAIKKSKRLLLFWSRHASESKFVEEEWRNALQAEGCSVVPIMLDATPLPNELKKFHGTNELQQITTRLRLFTRITRWLTILFPIIVLLGILSYPIYQHFEAADRKSGIVLRGGKTAAMEAPENRMATIIFTTIGCAIGFITVSYSGIRRSRRKIVEFVRLPT